MLHTYGDGEVTVRFIAGKVKVAPTKARVCLMVMGRGSWVQVVGRGCGCG